MVERMIAYIKSQKLFEENDKVLLAVSGGADSVVLTDLISKAGFKYAIAHCNFKLRGKESDDDERFVKSLAKRYGVKFFNISFDTENFAFNNKLSIQMAARELRYNWFEKIRKENKFDFICTAHHLNDSIETVLVNLTKGTGISGLTGIKPKNKKIVRPLLFATRKEIEEYTTKNKIKYRLDASNLSEDYVRNKIRLSVIPVLKEINPSLETTFLYNMQNLQDVNLMSDEYFKLVKNKILKKDKDDFTINIKELKNYVATGTILYYLVREFNFSSQISSQIFQTLDLQSGKKFYSATHELIKDRKTLIISKLKNKNTDNEIRINESNRAIKLYNFELKIFKLDLKKVSVKNKLNKILKNENYAALDMQKLEFPLILRKWKNGDQFIPFGMKGKKKKLSDYFVDKKVPINKKEQINVITSGGEIAWVVGYRVDERFAITETTTNVFSLQFIKHNEDETFIF